MKKLAIIAILAIVLLACVPIMPSRNQTNKTIENVTIQKVVQETPPQETTPATPPQETEKQPETPPELKDIPIKEVMEGELVSFPNLKAVDPDGDKITYTFTPPLNSKGQWQTKEGDAGDKLVTITASDGTNTVSQQVLIRIKPKNKPPVIELKEPIEGTEGQTITLAPNVIDPDGDIVTVTYSGWMNTSTKQLTFDDSGLHKVIITATDGKTTITKEAIISVKNANRAPELADIPPIKIKEGQKATVKPTAKDVDGDRITYIYEFPLDDTGVWQTEIGDAGDYDVAIKASDGQLTSEKTVKITVEAVNRPPVIKIENTITVKEGDTVKLSPEVTDPEGDEFRITYSGWMTTTTKDTGYDDQGNHKVTITARDTGGHESKVEIIVTVTDVNRPPIFGAGSFN